MIRIIAIGKKHEAWITHGLERYQKRLRKPFNVEWILLPHSSVEGLEARHSESRMLLSRLGADEFVVLLDELGKNITSSSLSELCQAQFTNGRSVVIIIGGAYGVDDTVTARADFIWSLSKLVFPHQLVRLLLIEQLYRAQEIASGGKYHHI